MGNGGGGRGASVSGSFDPMHIRRIEETIQGNIENERGKEEHQLAYRMYNIHSTKNPNLWEIVNV